MQEKKQSVFDTLNKINVNEYVEKKGNLSYLSWSFAWQTLKANYPESNYTVYENDLGFNYHTDGHTAWVKVGVTVVDVDIKGNLREQEHIEYLPVMDYKNKSVPKDAVTSMAVNTAIQRGLTKAIARHGLGLYIYAGEDVPSENPTSQKLYQTWSKATPTDKDNYKREFWEVCKSHNVEVTEFIDFLGMSDAPENEKHNLVVQYLRSEELFEDQMESYKLFKIKQDAS